MLSQYFFIIFVGVALLSSIAMIGRQPLIVAYIALGALVGPYGLAAVTDIHLLQEMAELGIIFLLFLLGLDMQPSALKSVFSKAISITLFSSLLFFALGFCTGLILGYSTTEALILAICLIFSSTIIGIKLLPTTALHHKHVGELMIGLLLMQDFIAIFALLVILGMNSTGLQLSELSLVIINLPLLVIVATLIVRYIIYPLIARYDRISEYVFLLALGWCLGIAHLAEALGLSAETGAFIAGVTLATNPVSQFIALNLKPLRDFFLVIFFFAVGAGFNLQLLPDIWLPAVLLGVAVIIIKPLVFRFLARKQSESNQLAWDIGFRLGQMSEFSLLIIILALQSGLIREQVAVLVQASAIITFLISSYIIVFNYPNPMAISDKLRKD